VTDETRELQIEMPDNLGAVQDGQPSNVQISPITTRDFCLVCGEQTHEVLAHVVDNRLGVPGEFAIHECPKCGLEQTLPRPLPDVLKQLYEIYYNFGGERGTKYTRMREWFFESRIYRAWLAADGDGSFHARRGRGRLLDVGCNEGRGLKIYRHNGFSAEGLELNSRAAELARENGFVVYETLLQDFRPADLYDVVVLSNVLEHSLDPKRMLCDISRILSPFGQVWISCPNSKSWLREFFGRAWINWHVPFHLAHFSSESVRDLLQAAGFTRVRVTQITPALWVASSIIASLFSRNARPTRQLRNPLLILPLIFFSRMLMFPILSWQNRKGKGDCLIVTANLARIASTER